MHICPHIGILSSGIFAQSFSVDAVENEIRAAIRFHIDGLKADALPVPAPNAIAEYVEANRSSRGGAGSGVNSLVTLGLDPRAHWMLRHQGRAMQGKKRS